MTYSEAIEYKNKNADLIGTTDRGVKVGKLIIVPSDKEEQERFLESYLRICDEEVAIMPFMNDSVEVWAIDIEHLYQNNALFYKRLA